MIIINFPSAD